MPLVFYDYDMLVLHSDVLLGRGNVRPHRRGQRQCCCHQRTFEIERHSHDREVYNSKISTCFSMHCQKRCEFFMIMRYFCI